jgi:hypothetical protein
MYRVRNDAAEAVQLPVGSGGGLNRIDTIIARVRDSQYSGLDNDWVLEVVAGTAGAGAGATTTAFTSAVLATAGAVPDDAIVLGYVRVLAADTLTSTIVAGDVSDARSNYSACSSGPWAEIYKTATVTVNSGGTGSEVATYDVVNHLDRAYFEVVTSGLKVLQAGVYNVWVAASYQDAFAAANKAAGFRLNSAGAIALGDSINVGSAAGEAWLFNIFRPRVTLAANDIVNVVYFQDSGVPRNAYGPIIQLHKVG